MLISQGLLLLSLLWHYITRNKIVHVNISDIIIIIIIIIIPYYYEQLFMLIQGAAERTPLFEKQINSKLKKIWQTFI